MQYTHESHTLSDQLGLEACDGGVLDDAGRLQAIGQPVGSDLIERRWKLI